MLAWLVPSVIALGALAWGMYSYWHPRKLSKLHYRIMDQSIDNLLIPGAAPLEGYIDSYTDDRHIDVMGKCIEIKSVGNFVSTGILIHVRLKHEIAHWRVETDERYERPYGARSSGEFNVRVNYLNPTDILRVLLFCDKRYASDDQDVLLEYRITSNDGVATKVEEW